MRSGNSSIHTPSSAQVPLVSTCVCLHLCIYICVYECVCVFVDMFVFVCIICVCAVVCMCVFVCMFELMLTMSRSTHITSHHITAEQKVVKKETKEIVTTITSRRFIIAVGGRPTPLDVPVGGELAISSDDLFMKKVHCYYYNYHYCHDVSYLS